MFPPEEVPSLSSWAEGQEAPHQRDRRLPSWFRSRSAQLEPRPQLPGAQQPSPVPVAWGGGWRVLASSFSELVQLVELQLRSQDGEALI